MRKFIKRCFVFQIIHEHYCKPLYYLNSNLLSSNAKSRGSEQQPIALPSNSNPKATAILKLLQFPKQFL